MWDLITWWLTILYDLRISKTLNFRMLLNLFRMFISYINIETLYNMVTFRLFNNYFDNFSWTSFE